MKREHLYRPNWTAMHAYDLYNEDGYVAMDGYKKQAESGKKVAWVYVFDNGKQVADMAYKTFEDYFTPIPPYMTKKPTKAERAERRIFHVTIKETVENVYTIEASDAQSAVELASKGRLGVRLNQKLIGYNVLKAEIPNTNQGV